MAIQVPKIRQNTALLGAVKRDTSPIISNRQFVPDAVAPPIGALKHEQAAKTGLAIAGAAEDMEGVFTQRKNKRDRNDAVTTNLAYNEEITALQNEFMSKKGKEAYGAQEEFYEKVIEIESRLLDPLNVDVRQLIEPLMSNTRLRTGQRIFMHEQREMDTETTANTQLLAESWALDALNSATPNVSTERNIGKINNVTLDDVPTMTESQLELWKITQRDGIYSSIMQQFTEDPFNEAHLRTANDYFSKYKKDMGKDARKFWGPTVHKNTFKFVVQDEMDRMGDMNYSDGVKWIDSQYDPDSAINKGMKHQLVQDIKEDADLEVARGIELAKGFHTEWSKIPKDPYKRLIFLDDFVSKLGPDDEKAFFNHSLMYRRMIRVNPLGLKEGAREFFRTKMDEDPSYFGSEEMATDINDHIELGILSPNEGTLIEQEESGRRFGTNRMTGKQGPIPQEGLTSELNAHIDDNWPITPVGTTRMQIEAHLNSSTANRNMKYALRNFMGAAQDGKPVTWPEGRDFIDMYKENSAFLDANPNIIHNMMTYAYVRGEGSLLHLPEVTKAIEAASAAAEGKGIKIDDSTMKQLTIQAMLGLNMETGGDRGVDEDGKIILPTQKELGMTKERYSEYKREAVRQSTAEQARRHRLYDPRPRSGVDYSTNAFGVPNSQQSQNVGQGVSQWAMGSADTIRNTQQKKYMRDAGVDFDTEGDEWLNLVPTFGGIAQAESMPNLELQQGERRAVEVLARYGIHLGEDFTKPEGKMRHQLFLDLVDANAPEHIINQFLANVPTHKLTDMLNRTLAFATAGNETGRSAFSDRKKAEIGPRPPAWDKGYDDYIRRMNKWHSEQEVVTHPENPMVKLPLPPGGDYEGSILSGPLNIIRHGDLTQEQYAYVGGLIEAVPKAAMWILDAIRLDTSGLIPPERFDAMEVPPRLRGNIEQQSIGEL